MIEGNLIEVVENKNRVRIDNGFGIYSNFDAIAKTRHNCYLKIMFNDGSKFECSKNHPVILAKDLLKSTASALRVGSVLLRASI